MLGKRGNNIRELKQSNRALVLKIIATRHDMCRVDLARITGLTKMAVGNLVNDLIEMKLVQECEAQIEGSVCGRRPLYLKISNESFCICGMLIERELFQVILADLSGNIISKKDIVYSGDIKKEEIAILLMDAFEKLKKETAREIIAVGVSSIGPLNIESGVILNPPLFYGIENLNIVEILEKKTQLPVFLINDANAGALAEKLYGAEENIANFAYLYIMNGIGSGYILDNKIYNGDSGQSGEIGHTSINFMGPHCPCGNNGCLELYASVSNMKKRIKELLPLYNNSKLARFTDTDEISWLDIIDASNQNDDLAITVVEEFCTYLAHAVTNTLNLLDISYIVVGYNATSKGNIIEKILENKISSSVIYSHYRKVKIVHSSFGGDAPLIGSIACVADKVFNLSLPLPLKDKGDLLC